MLVFWNSCIMMMLAHDNEQSLKFLMLYPVILLYDLYKYCEPYINIDENIPKCILYEMFYCTRCLIFVRMPIARLSLGVYS